MKNKFIRCALFMVALIVIVIVACYTDAINNKTIEQTTEQGEQTTEKKEFKKVLPYHDFDKNEYLNKRVHLLEIKYMCGDEELKSAHIEKVLYGEVITVTAPEIDFYKFKEFNQGGNIHTENSFSAMFTENIQLTVYYDRVIDTDEVSDMYVAYTSGTLNIREEATTVSTKVGRLTDGTKIQVYGYDKDKEWSAINYNGQQCYVATKYLSTTEIAKKQNNNSSVSAGKYPVMLPDLVAPSTFYPCTVVIGSKVCTPDEVDAIFAAYAATIGKQYPAGTTVAWQRKLYNSLTEAGIQWWYPYAMANIAYESHFYVYQIHHNLNKSGQITSTDYGLFQMNSGSWRGWCRRVGVPETTDSFDIDTQIKIYVSFMSEWLLNNHYDKEVALTCHNTRGYSGRNNEYIYNGFPYKKSYVQGVLNRISWINYIIDGNIVPAVSYGK